MNADEALKPEVPTLVLNANDSKAFIEALLNPRPPDERLLRALERHKVLVKP